MTLIIEFNEGAGNAVFPLLEGNKNPDLNLRAYDYSSHAVKLVQVFIPICIKLFRLKMPSSRQIRYTSSRQSARSKVPYGISPRPTLYHLALNQAP